MEVGVDKGETGKVCVVGTDRACVRVSEEAGGKDVWSGFEFWP